MPCEPKSWQTAMVKDGKRQMMAQAGNKKFKARELHPQCADCTKEMMEEAELSIMFHGDQKLIDQYKRVEEIRKKLITKNKITSVGYSS